VTPTFRTCLAGASLLAAGALVAALAAASRLAAGAAPAGLHERLPLPPAARRLAGLADDGRPVLLLVLDPSCGACELARADLEADPGLGLPAAGVAVAALPRSRLPEAGLRLPGGFFPAYLLFDEEGRLLAARRGYGTPEAIRRWVRNALVGAADPPPGCRPTRAPSPRAPAAP